MAASWGLRLVIAVLVLVTTIPLSTAAADGDEEAALDLLAGDVGEAEWGVQELIEKRDSWARLCDLKPKGSLEWKQCQGVLQAEQVEVVQKEQDADALSKKQQALMSQVEHRHTQVVQAAQKVKGTKSAASFVFASTSASAVKQDAADAIGDDLSQASVELNQLEEKRDQWQALCSQLTPSQQNLLHRNASHRNASEPQKQKQGLKLTQLRGSSGCLKVLKGIETDLEDKKKEIVSYQAAIAGLQVSGK